MTTGTRGNLGFAVQSDSALAPVKLEQALTVGDRLDLLVYSPTRPGDPQSYMTVMGRRELRANKVKRIPVVRVTSSAPEVLAVTRTDDGGIRLQGVAAGTTTVEVETATGKDRLKVAVADIGYAAISHSAWKNDLSPADTVLLCGGLAHFTVTRKGPSGQLLTGYGAARAVEIVPADAARVENLPRDTSRLRIRPRQPGRLALNARGGTGLSLEVVEPERVTKLSVAAEEGTQELRVNDLVFLQIAAFLPDGRRALGLDGLVSFAVRTPEVCKIEDEWMSWLGVDILSLQGVTAGQCEVEARLADQTATLSIRVVGTVHPTGSPQPTSQRSPRAKTTPPYTSSSIVTV